MILIASDKFKGTLTAQEVCNTLCEIFGKERCVNLPMADGGEGTAAILADVYAMQRDARGWYANPETGIAAVDSSEHIGIEAVARAGKTVMSADSSPLGAAVREMAACGYVKIFIGIGGTGTCDGGVGFLNASGYIPLGCRLTGLTDVFVPLTAEDDNAPSALMFVRQKGAKNEDIPILKQRLQNALKLTGRRSSCDGAGGGLGFALASVMGAPCFSGAKMLLDAYNPDWTKIDLVVTGEGCFDNQTSRGKVVHCICVEAERHNVPALIIAGKATVSAPRNATLLSTENFLPDLPLNRDTALQRLRLAARFASEKIIPRLRAKQIPDKATKKGDV